MELQIQDLISSIKKDGIDAVNKEAEEILESAKKQAATIIQDAKAEAQKIKENNEKEIAIFKSNAELNAEQAKRDALLAFKNEVKAEYENLLAADVKKAMDDKALVTLMAAALKGEDVKNFTAELASASDALKAELAKEIKEGLEIKVSKDVQSGFRLAAKDGSGYFDCSDEEIMKMLMPFFRDIKL